MTISRTAGREARCERARRASTSALGAVLTRLARLLAHAARRLEAPRATVCGHGAIVLLVCALAGSCDREPVARVVTAEFQDDKIADGKVDPDETIVLALDRQLPPEFRPERVYVRDEPATSPWGHDVKVGADRRSLDIVIVGRPDFRLDGVFGSDESASGLVIELGDGVEQRVDLLRRRSVPRLIRAWWEDAQNPSRNGAIDEGDRVHLVFDEPVELAPDVDGQRVHVPHHVLLSQDGIDRLDDGERPSEWTAGEDPNEVVIVLGSRPLLRLAPHEPTDERRSWSAIATNGTLLRPLPLVRARAGGLGVASQGEVFIERPPDYANAEPRPDESFPSPGGRKLHTVTPLADRFVAVVAGGESTETGEILDDVLVYSLFADGFPGRSRWVGRERLPRPVVDHTATFVPGGDRSRDGFVLIAGGRDGVAPSGDLTVIRLGGESESPVVVEKLETSLLVPRWGHRAVAVGGNLVVIDGGLTLGRNGERALVGATEIIELERAEESVRDRDRRVRVRSRRVVHNLPREGHSLTVLGGGNTAPWVLAYGGHGYSPERWRLLRGAAIGTEVGEASSTQYPTVGTDPPFGLSKVLSAPVFIQVANPSASIVGIAQEPRYSFLRYGHSAVAIEPIDDDDGAPTTTALIVGGTLEHPERGWESASVIDTWDVPLETVAEYRRGVRPEDAFSAILVSFDPESPERTRLEEIPHPMRDPLRPPTRLGMTATHVPGLGVLIAGGDPGSAENAHSTAELFVPHARALAPFALDLSAARTRHAALWVGDANRQWICLFGGATRPGDRGRFADVEVLPLPDRH